MRYPATHKAEVRERIVRAAGKILRRDGLEVLSIPRLMRDVGLTHGGFYNHFADRDEVVSEALRSAAQDGAFADVARPFEEAVRKYLSPEHAAHPEMGCVVAAIGGSGRTETASVRATIAEVARGFLVRIERKVSPRASGPRKHVSDEALRVASQLVGAVVLARAVDDAALAKRILGAVRASVLEK